MSYEIVLRVTEVPILQLILVVIAWKALSVWKARNSWTGQIPTLARNLLESIKGVRF